MRPDTLWFDMDREIATMIVRGVTPVAVPDAASRVTARVESFVRESPSEGLGSETRLGALGSTSGLPFVPAANGPRPSSPPRAPSEEEAGGETVRLRKIDVPEIPPKRDVVAPRPD